MPRRTLPRVGLFCLGAPLARLEGQLAIGGLVRRFPKMQQAGEPVRRERNEGSGLIEPLVLP